MSKGVNKNMDKVNWHWLCENPNAIPIITKALLKKENKKKIDWIVLSENPNAISILEKNLDKVSWIQLSKNPNAISILEKNLDKVNWGDMSENPNAIPILEQNLDRVNWSNLSKNPNAIPILEQNLDRVNWSNLSKNPNAIHILEKHLDRVDWNSLVEFNSNESPEMLSLVEKGYGSMSMDAKIIMLRRPYIFILDTTAMMEQGKSFAEDVTALSLNPARYAKTLYRHDYIIGDDEDYDEDKDKDKDKNDGDDYVYAYKEKDDVYEPNKTKTWDERHGLFRKNYMSKIFPKERGIFPEKALM